MLKYSKPEMEAVLLAVADVITASVEEEEENKGNEGEVVTPGLGGRT